MPHGPQAGIAGQATRLAARAVLLAAVVAAVVTPAIADAASVAYVDKGEVWLASLDGAKKARLATPVVNGDGETENWIDVAQSDGGRIVAVRNKPGRMSSFSWFKIWEPDGTSTVEGPLNAPGGWASYTYPLGFDITADGSHLVYGYSNSGFCCPDLVRSRHVRPAGDQQLARTDQHRRPDAPLALRLAGHLGRGLLVAGDHQRPGRGVAAIPTRPPSPSGSTPRRSGLDARRRRRRGQRAHGGAGFEA